MLLFNPIALRKAKIVYNFGLSECNRDNSSKYMLLLHIHVDPSLLCLVFVSKQAFELCTCTCQVSIKYDKI